MDSFIFSLNIDSTFCPPDVQKEERRRCRFYTPGYNVMEGGWGGFSKGTGELSMRATAIVCISQKHRPGTL